MTDLEGVAFVTGGCGALGRALCARLSSAGMTAVSVDLPGVGADVDLDVTDADAARRAVEQVVEIHGRLDVVISNAGIGAAGVVETLSADAWSRAVAVNLGGAINVLRATYPTMIGQRRGHHAQHGRMSMFLAEDCMPTPLTSASSVEPRVEGMPPSRCIVVGGTHPTTLH